MLKNIIYFFLIASFTIFIGGANASQSLEQGILQTYWKASWNDSATVNTPVLGFRYFYFDTKQKKEKVIDIVLSGEQYQQIDFIKKNFKNIPSNFFQYKEWYINQTGILTVDRIKHYVECNANNYTAKLVKFSPDLSSQSPQTDKFETLASCGQNGRYPYLTGYHLKPGLDNVWLKSSPDDNASNAYTASSDKSLVKIKTINSQWIYAAFYDYTRDDRLSEQKGYIKLSDLVPDN